jgi:hypothetical protein
MGAGKFTHAIWRYFTIFWRDRPLVISGTCLRIKMGDDFRDVERVVWITRAGLPRCSILERPMPSVSSPMPCDDGGGK